MSRCFPFPPPGYEKKLRSDHVDFLIKENSKEKKHKKKEKREKEKKEGKERKDKHKDKDRSKDKHREKKDKKGQHKDKSKKKGKYRDKDNKIILNERNGQGHTGGHNEQTLAEGGKADNQKGSSITEESVKGIRDEENGAVNPMGNQITAEVRRFQNMCNSSEERNVGTEMVHNITVPEQKRPVMVGAMENRHTGKGMLRSTGQRRVDGMGGSTDKGPKGVQPKEKAKEWRVDDREGDKKHKDTTDREKKHKRKGKDRDKEKAKEEKRREKKKHKHKEQDKSLGIGQRAHVDLQNVVSSVNSQENKKNTGAETNLKRKEINGFLHENELRPKKLARSASSSLLPVENGAKSDPSYIVTPCASDKHESVNIMVERVLDRKEHEINGVTVVQPPSKSGPPPVTGLIESAEAFKKPPHPDEEYLSQLLHLPKMEEWSEFDDQEWLLSSDGAQQRPKTKLGADEMPQVWDKALHVDSADVLALPYVIPY